MTVAILAIPLAGGVPAFAATNSFVSQYQEKATMEQSLLQKAQASSVTNATIEALFSTVTLINTQVTALYASWQALQSGISSIPHAPETSSEASLQMKQLTSERIEILQKLNAVWKLVISYDHHPHRKGLLHTALEDHARLSGQLERIDRQIAAPKKDHGVQYWVTHPYDSGYGGLQNDILRLQQSAIHYTREMITLENSGTTLPETTIVS